jgi:deoxycytidylate deaminase
MTCAKQRVIATIITPGGERIVGENSCRTPQPVCPRAGMATGVGYELCRSICDQTGHAEAVALDLAGGRAQGATLYIEGHTYACDDCLRAAEAAGIVAVVIGAPPDIVLSLEAFDEFRAMLDNPPEPTEALRELMARKAPWES